MAKQYDFSDFDNKPERADKKASGYDFSDFDKSSGPSIMDSLLSAGKPAVDAVKDIYSDTIAPAQNNSLNALLGGFVPKIEGAVSAVGRAAGLGNAGKALKEQLLSASAGPMGPTMNAINGNTLELLPPTLDMDVLGKTYEDAKNQSAAQMKSDFDKAPITSSIGSVASAVASPINKILPGAGASGIVAGMKGAAAAGGLNALSQADLAHPMDAAMNVGTDSAIGAGLAATLGLGGKVIAGVGKGIANSSLGKAAMGTDSLQKMKEIYQTAAGGKNLQGKEVTEQLNDELGGHAADIVNYGKKKLEDAGKQYANLLNPATLENVLPTQIALETLAKDMEKNPTNAQALKGVVGKLRDLSANADVVTHAQIQDEFLGPIEQQLKALYGDKSGAVKLSQIEDLIYGNNPQLAKLKNEVARNYAEQKTLMNTMGVDPGAITSQAVKKENIATNNLTQSLRGSDKVGTPTADKVNTLESLLSGNPQMVDKLNQARGLSHDLSLNKSLREAPIPWSGAGYNAANFLGTAQHTVTNEASKVMSSVDKIGKVSGKLKGTALGNKLDEILQMEPKAQSRAIFTISQQPWFRKLSEDEQK